MDNQVPGQPQQTNSQAKASRKPHHALNRSHYLLVAGALFMSTLMGFIGGWLGAENKLNSGNLSQSSQQQIVSSESDLISEIAEEVGPSVVSVNVSTTTQQQGFFGTEEVEQESAGTGFVIEKNIIVTNRHVVPASASTVSVTLSDGTELEKVKVIGRTNSDDPLDVAFLRVNDTEGNKLEPVDLGNSADMEVGDKVVAIGNALGQFQNTVTSGILSGYSRSVEALGEDGGVEILQNLFQTDAAINQGNSGGPLVNINGEVIGINTAVAADSENIGFAIPIDDVKGLIDSVVSKAS